MKQYSPNKWVIINLDNKVCKILGGWSGGYMDSDEWRLSSGITGLKEDGDYYLFKNYSGSVYKCHKNNQGFTQRSSSKYTEIKEGVEGVGKNINIIEDMVDLFFVKD